MSRFDFPEIMTRMMARIPDTLDKREGSIIHDAMAPAAAELAQIAIEIAVYEEQTYLLTAVGVNLDNRAADYWVFRNPATFAIRIGELMDTAGEPMNLPIGSRFSVPNVAGGLNFAIIENVSAGKCFMQCETPGMVGNAYLGPILPLFNINNLGQASLVGTQIPAEDEESDADLRQRVIDKITKTPFGGNMEDYRQFTTAIEGVGNVKIFPVWNGGGTVKLSIVDGAYQPVSPEFIDVVQTLIDPEVNQGIGLGYAPIGHWVTVVTPDQLDIDIYARIMLRDGYQVPQVQEEAEQALNAYLFNIKKTWPSSTSLSIFIARIIAALVDVDGIYNVMEVRINGEPNDFVIPQTALLQQLPVLHEVVLERA